MTAIEKNRHQGALVFRHLDQRRQFFVQDIVDRFAGFVDVSAIVGDQRFVISIGFMGIDTTGLGAMPAINPTRSGSTSCS